MKGGTAAHIGVQVVACAVGATISHHDHFLVVHVRVGEQSFQAGLERVLEMVVGRHNDGDLHVLLFAVTLEKDLVVSSDDSQLLFRWISECAVTHMIDREGVIDDARIEMAGQIIRD